MQPCPAKISRPKFSPPELPKILARWSKPTSQIRQQDKQLHIRACSSAGRAKPIYCNLVPQKSRGQNFRHRSCRKFWQGGQNPPRKFVNKTNNFIFGLVAQLGERSVRIREVEGSNPFRSTTKSCEISYFTAFLQLFGEIYMDANRAFPANFGDFREYWPQSVRIRVMRERTL